MWYDFAGYNLGTTEMKPCKFRLKTYQNDTISTGKTIKNTI